MIRRAMFVLPLLSLVGWAQVILHPGDNVPKIVSSKPPGTTFIFTAGTYRLATLGTINPLNGDVFKGQDSCAPPATSCDAIISGSIVIGSSAVKDPASGYYKVAKQTQQNPGGQPGWCLTGWEGCYHSEDLFLDGVPSQHLECSAITSCTIGPGQWWFDYANHIIYFHDDPAGHTVETSVLANAFGGAANNVTISQLTVEGFANYQTVAAIAMQRFAKASTEETNWLIENCEIRLSHWMGIQVEYRMRILNNYVHDNGGEGVGGGFGKATPELVKSNSGIVIQGNTITNNNYSRIHPGHSGGGVKFGGVTGAILRGNTINGNLGEGIHFDSNSGGGLVDGNVITNNTDQSALADEISFGPSIWRNNLILGNGRPTLTGGPYFSMHTQASSGLEAYCNVIEIPNYPKAHGWLIGSSNRGNSDYPPYQHLASTGNYFHHNTVIWDAGATGKVGFSHNDPNQSSFFGDNPPPDYNTYHAPRTSDANFMYDNDNSHNNRGKSFSSYQASGADVHGTLDTHYNSGYPQISITSPGDQSSVSNPVAVTAAASDKSGIRKVEFYVDWTLQATITNPPYDFNWTNGASGSHTVAAMAYSNAGIRACYAVTLNEQ
jgi:parallel beta-helix repeat protein